MIKVNLLHRSERNVDGQLVSAQEGKFQITLQRGERPQRSFATLLM